MKDTTVSLELIAQLRAMGMNASADLMERRYKDKILLENDNHAREYERVERKIYGRTRF